MNVSEILKNSKTIAIVGLSDKPDRPSYDVAKYLMQNGYTIIPINPMIQEWCGVKAYKSLLEIPKETKVDIVDIFRKSEDVPLTVEEAIKLGAKTVWMQLGVFNEDAAAKARFAGLNVVMDKCIKIEHSKV